MWCENNPVYSKMLVHLHYYNTDYFILKEFLYSNYWTSDHANVFLTTQDIQSCVIKKHTGLIDQE